MQKIVFMASANLMQEITMEMGILAIAIKKEDEDASHKLLREIEKSFVLVNKSVRAFFMDNNKEPFPLLDFDGTLAYNAQKKYAQGELEDLKLEFIPLLKNFRAELAKHDGDRVYHDNGAVWNKDKNDKNRFIYLSDHIDSIYEIVS